ncbi:MAG: hypothetical protein P4M13_08005 [Alphaproteobacteria bacterium]|nr:hypothetical protein [Alphaproteobacteria bacterium]
MQATLTHDTEEPRYNLYALTQQYGKTIAKRMPSRIPTRRRKLSVKQKTRLANHLMYKAFCKAAHQDFTRGAGILTVFAVAGVSILALIAPHLATCVAASGTVITIEVAPNFKEDLYDLTKGQLLENGLPDRSATEDDEIYRRTLKILQKQGYLPRQTDSVLPTGRGSPFREAAVFKK